MVIIEEFPFISAFNRRTTLPLSERTFTSYTGIWPEDRQGHPQVTWSLTSPSLPEGPQDLE